MNKNYNKTFLACLLAAALLTSCSSNSVVKTNTTSEETTSVSAATDASAVTSDMITYDSNDYYTDWKNENPTYIKLSGNTAQIDGSGAKQSGSKITVSKAGVYVVSGKTDNGQIIVETEDKGLVRLVLNGADITCADNAPIYVTKAEKTVISLEDGTQNNLTDGKSYVLADASTDEPSAAVFSKDDLTLNGTGTLTINANYKDGVTSKDDLKITAGNIIVNSADDGLVGKDMVLVKEGNITIKAGGDGIKSTNDTDASKGFIALEDGNYKINSGADGIQAETSLLIAGGEFAVTTGGGSANASVKSDKMQGPMGGMGRGAKMQFDSQQNAPGGTQPNPPAETQQNASATSAASSEEESQSAKAIKAASDITIKGGTFTIDSMDDAIHSNNSVNIVDGDISITSGDDGAHADSLLTIAGGKINITKSYEGLESSVINISDGEINVAASDDGINASGGSDQSAMNGRPGQNSDSSSSDNKLNISGGYITVNANGDGLDANGSIYITDGTIVVSGPTNDGNAALDYDAVFEMSGGMLISAGSSGMAQAPSETSAQNSVMMYYSTAQQAGTLVHLQDNAGNTIATFAPAKQYQSVLICSPELKNGTSYTLYSGGTATGTVSNGLYGEGKYENGSKIVDFTISSSVTYLTETGVTTARSNTHGGQMGGQMGGQRGGFGGGKMKEDK